MKPDPHSGGARPDQNPTVQDPETQDPETQPRKRVHTFSLDSPNPSLPEIYGVTSVAQLIGLLRKMPPELPVVIVDGEMGTLYSPHPPEVMSPGEAGALDEKFEISIFGEKVVKIG